MMKRRKLYAQPYFDIPECECGGLLKDRVKAKFVCDKCEKIYTLAEPDWPRVKYYIQESEQ
jgi:uncharacterized protein (DUF983 family)